MTVFIIAEIGVNHNGSVQMAKNLIIAAKNAGADAVKFQTFFADELVTRKAKKAKYQAENMGTDDSQYDMLKALELSRSELLEISLFCDQNDIEFLSTPFSESAADLLEEVGVKRYKVSSGDLTHLPFLKYIAQKNLPIILSTGMANISEIEEAVSVIKMTGNEQISVLHCVSNYPAAVEDCNLNAMKTMYSVLGLPIGWSDHTLGSAVSIASIAIGAEIIEKHITLDQTLEGPDHKASMEPDEFVRFVDDIRAVELAMGDGIKTPSPAEMETATVARRSLVLANNLSKGHQLSPDDIKIIRPGTGLSPKYYEAIIGLKLGSDLEIDTPLQWEHFHDLDEHDG